MDRDIDRAQSFEGVVVPIRVLETAPLFEGLGPEELAGAAALMRFRSFRPGEVICREGQQGDSMFVVVDGLVHLLASLAEQPEVRTRSIFDEGRLVGKLRRGDVLGTGALITGAPRSATAKAAVATDLLELGRDDFRALVGRFPRMLENLTAILTRRLAEATSVQARARRRGEALGLVTGPSLEGAVPEVLAAVVSSSPGSVESLDARESLTDVLDRLDAALREHGTVIAVAAIDDDLPLVMRHVDRTVALVGTSAESDHLCALAADHGVQGQPVEVVLAPEVELTADAGDSVRVVHVAERKWARLALCAGRCLGGPAPRPDQAGARLGGGGSEGLRARGGALRARGGRLQGRLRER